MLKFEEMLIKGRTAYIGGCAYNNYTQLWEWQKFYDECRLFIEETKNRKPIVDFKVRVDVISKYK